MNIRYFVLLQNHYFDITTRYYIVTTPLFPDYCFIITISLNFNVHYFDYYQVINTSLLRIIVDLLCITCLLLRHYCMITTKDLVITASLLRTYYHFITTRLLRHYYTITTILLQLTVFIITWSILRSIAS